MTASSLEVAPPGGAAVLLAFGLQVLHYCDRSSYGATLKVLEPIAALSEVGDIDFPRTRDEYRLRHAAITQRVIDALESGAVKSLFLLQTYSIDLVLQIVFEQPSRLDVEYRMRSQLRNLGLQESSLESLSRDARSVPTYASATNGLPTVNPDFVWMISRSFMLRVLDDCLGAGFPAGVRAVEFSVKHIGSLQIGSVQNMHQNSKVISIEGSHVSAPVTVADHIERGFNATDDSSLDDDLKQLLTELTTAVLELAKTTPSDVAQTMARDIETLSNELASQSPRRSWWQLSLDSLKDAATSLGATATPVLPIIEAIAKLL